MEHMERRELATWVERHPRDSYTGSDITFFLSFDLHIGANPVLLILFLLKTLKFFLSQMVRPADGSSIYDA